MRPILSPQSGCQVARSTAEGRQLVVRYRETVGEISLFGGPDRRSPAVRREIVGGRVAIAGVEQLGQVDVRADPLSALGESLGPVGRRIPHVHVLGGDPATGRRQGRMVV